MLKKDLRIAFKKKREALSLAEIDEKSLAIANQVLQLQLWEYSFFHLFLSIERLKEINTEYLLHILNGKDKNIVVSKSEFEALTMKHFLLTDATPLKLNKWGIPEPVNGIEIPATQLDVVFIPLLAFDEKGNRIGYGKGFYDRFLNECKEDVIKVGLSFFEATTTIEDTNANDIPLDFCVTPEKIYRFN
ncbi:5-formyltetrahydrofolate cyclo-ligase [Mesonia mobilis]|uniref:5-formyltetrahydrofolate cyclo-ligase n=1 Tax=Mesonia mobilis TaxID=369791 RepID=A0ABQ3BRA7_9FLAO|nr:5-formyltetrahydrofolate cyclo-ligase [Mesonia mobilis]MBQ0737451.1 5-formyltetrahydrofolate cyclo-ligase [Aquimarina celericrescens]GGZ55033.1 5-formyltetrahydrofolate cyclo-ligase [Mesonia mobilis]